MPYRPIENYGVIGDLRTVALVDLGGSIDWLCLPHFDSPSVFARLLDDDKGGHFSIHPVDEDTECKQFYWPDTNVLVTRFLSTDGAAELTDFMPVAATGEDHTRPCELVRRMTAVRGSIAFRMTCEPAFNFARDDHQTHLLQNGVRFDSPGLRLGLATRVPLERQGRGVTAEFTLREGESLAFVLRELRNEAECGLTLSPEEAEADFRNTVEYWRRWLSQCRYTGRWREMVYRSALALKLLTFEPTGAIVAAPTCSLPEELGGVRNWDYRYSWIRDSAFTVYAFLRLGFTQEAEHYIEFLSSLCEHPDHDGSLQVIYGIDGRSDLTEETLDHLDGYKGSRPVRTGNGAHDQLQLDIYGELLDAVYLYNKYGEPISYNLWLSLVKFVDWVCNNWQREDEGVWEVRSTRRHFVYSKLMCWVALDRAIRLAEKRSFPADIPGWRRTRNTIYEDLMEKGWNEARGAFVQHYGSESLDAANLMMPLTFFVSPTDPRMLRTLDAIMKPPHEGGLLANSLVYRYNAEQTTDGLVGDEGTFNMCTFWLVEALTRAGRFHPERLDEARIIFERMLGFASHLGLYAEETGPRGEALGNFPQAFTHLALISAAFNLDRALDEVGASR